MGKYLKKFDTHAEYEEAKQNLILPNVSYCINTNDVHYNPIETRLVAKFNVIDTSRSTRILWNASVFTEIEIDGVKQPSVVRDYQFSATGEHIVKYTLADPAIIGEQAFAGSNALVSVIIPNSVTSIGVQAFVSTGLTSITMLNGVTSIGNNAFQGCIGLTSIVIPDSVTSIGVNAFNYCTSLISVTIGNSVTSIGQTAFGNCSSLTSITIGSGVTNIGTAAFQACNSLTEIIIPNNVENLGMAIFYNCIGLTSVTIGNGVTSIGGQAFQGCTNLSTITSHIMNAPSVNGGTFYNVKSGGTLYVPTGSSGYETWMNNQDNLGSYNWTKVEQ